MVQAVVTGIALSQGLRLDEMRDDEITTLVVPVPMDRVIPFINELDNNGVYCCLCGIVDCETKEEADLINRRGYTAEIIS